MNDGVDSICESTNVFTPFQNIINEFYAKYCIRSEAFGQGVETLMYAGQILDSKTEDAEELRRKIEAEESAQNIGALIGIAAGVALGVAERRKEAEQAQQPMQQSM